MKTSIAIRLGLSLVMFLFVSVAPGSAKTAAARPLAETPAVFATEEGFIEQMTVQDGMVFWAAACGGELRPPIAYVRIKPAGDGPIRTVFDGGPACTNNYSPVSSIAADNSYMYWVDWQGRLVKQRRVPAPGEMPTLILMTQTGTSLKEVAVDNNYIYWLEGAPSGRIVRLSKTDGSSMPLNIGGYIFNLQVDPSGAIYYLGSTNQVNTLYRATLAANGSIATQVIGSAGKAVTYTLGQANVYWAEHAASGSDLLIRSAPIANTGSISTLLTINGSGAPGIFYMTVDAANLYWVQRYSDYSEDIIRMPLATHISSVVTTYPANNYRMTQFLKTSGRYLFWVDAGVIYRVSAAATVPDLRVEDPGLEVVQAIQGPANDIPLIEGKDTYVRMYARLLPGSTGINSVNVSPPATLVGMRNGAYLPGSPLQPVVNNVVINTQMPDRRDSMNVILFKLPQDWTNGTVTLEGNLNPMHSVPEGDRNNNMAATNVTFHSISPYCLNIVPVETVDGVVYGPSAILDANYRRAASVWPLEHFDVGYNGGPAQRRPNIPLGIGGSSPYKLESDVEMGYLLWNLWWAYSFNTGYACNGVGTAIVAPVQKAGRLGMSGAGVLFFMTGNGSDVGGLSLAHELGHVLGRAHINCPSVNGDWPADPDGSYPYPPCQTDNDPPATYVGLDPISRRLFPPLTTADYMSYYSGALWTSDYTYRALLKKLNGGVALASKITLAAGDKLLVSGLLGPAPLMGYAVKVSGNEAVDIAKKIQAHMLPSLQYQLNTYDAVGNLLNSTPLIVQNIQTEGGASAILFSQLIDAQPAPARIEIHEVGKPGSIVSRTAGPNQPTLSITSPASGATIASLLQVAWNASDPDGDPLLFTVRYSPDGGTSWRVLGNQISEKSLSAMTMGLPGSTQALVQVIASDGLHSTSATAGPFSMPLHAPQVSIQNEADTEIYSSAPVTVSAGDTTSLRGFAYDIEDGQLSGPSLQWSLQGPVNRTSTGDTLPIDNLPPGSYQVSLTATDKDQETGKASITLKVKPKQVFDSNVAAVLDGYCDDPAYGFDLDQVKIRYADGSISEAHIVRAGNYLYGCLAGLPKGALTASFAALQFDLDNSGGPLAMPGDIGFNVSQDGAPWTSSGDGKGSFMSDSVPVGMAAAVSQTDISWNAEFRIDTARLNGWNKLVRMRIGHYWVNHTGDDYAWPVKEGWSSPSYWGLTALGNAPETHFLWLPVITHK